MVIAPPTRALLAALREACLQAGLDERGATLIHHYTNAVFWLPSERAVARIATGPHRHAHAVKAHRVTAWLATAQGFPAARPLPGAPIVAVHDVLVTFWSYYAQPDPAPPATSAHLAGLLRQLHDLPPPPTDLPAWQPLVSLETTLSALEDGPFLTARDRACLHQEITSTRSELAALDWPLGHGLIHGDAWVGNLLWDTSHRSPRLILGDWDGLSHGPREIDLIPTWHAATRYGRGTAWTRAFSTVYGYDLAAWPGYRTVTRMRDLVQLTGPLRRARPGNIFGRALRQRIIGLRTRDPATWTAL